MISDRWPSAHTQYSKRATISRDVARLQVSREVTKSVCALLDKQNDLPSGGGELLHKRVEGRADSESSFVCMLGDHFPGNGLGGAAGNSTRQFAFDVSFDLLLLDLQLLLQNSSDGVSQELT